MDRRLLLLLLLLAASTQARAELTAEQLLAKMRAAYKAVPSVELKVQTKFIRAKTVIALSTIEFLAPNKIRIETTGIPGLEGDMFRAVSDGSRVSMTGLPGGPIEWPYDYNRFIRSVPMLDLETLCYWDWAKQLSTAKGGNMAASRLAVKREDWQGQSYYVLEEHADRQGVFIRYFVEPHRFLIMKVLQYQSDSTGPSQENLVLKLHLRKPLVPEDFKNSRKIGE